MSTDHGVGSADEAIASAKTIVQGVFSVLQISKIIFVDDEPETSLDVESILPSVVAILQTWKHDQSENLGRICDLIDITAPEDIWTEQLKEHLQLPAVQQNSIIEELLEEADVGGAKGRTPDLLKKIIPNEDDLIVLLPEAWRDQKDELIKSASSDQRLFILFDQNLGGEPNDRTSEGTAYIQGIQEYIGEKVVCALISNTIQAGEEVSRWGDLAQSRGLQPNTFFPIAKSSANDIARFSKAIKKVALNFYCGAMNGALIEAIDVAVDEAKSRLSNIDPYDYDWMVLRSSLAEGVAEVQTLIRIFEAFQNDNFFAHFWVKNNASKFQEAVGIARELSKTEEHMREDHPEDRHSIRRLEVVEPNIDVVNQSYQPIQCGDVFRFSDDNSKDFVLVGQSCDLIIRRDGKRSNQSAGRLFTLVPLREMRPAEADKVHFSSSVMRLDRFFSDTNGHAAIIDFAKAKQVDSDVLDLAGMAADGKCLIDVNNLSKKPPHLHAGWLKRIQILERAYKQKAKNIDQIVNALKDDHLIRCSVRNACHIGPSWNIDDLLYADSVFDFKLRRVERIRPTQAEKILVAYGAYLVRPGEGHDYAKDGVAKDNLIKAV